MSPEIRAAEPAAGFWRAKKSRSCWKIRARRGSRVENSIVIIHQGVIPGIGLEPLVAVIDFPSVLASGLAESSSKSIARVLVGGSGGVFHIFAGQLDRKSRGRTGWNLVSRRSGAD